MTRGGPLFLYETPLFGSPWLVPFEFPIYQWLVAALAGSGLPITLDQSARLVSVAALIGCLWPLRVSLRQFGASPGLVASASVLFLVAPIHVFWGRAALMESMALLFAMGFLSTVQLMIARRQWIYIPAAIVLATAAALVKITTFCTFGALAGVIVAFALASDLRSGAHRRAIWLAVSSALPMVVALISLLTWLNVSDAAKANAPLTAWLGSSQLSGWNYGTAEQRISADFWIDAVIRRMLPDVLGYAVWLVPGLLAFSLASKDKRGLLLWCLLPLALFVFPMLVFTNLHKVHNYYQMANAVFLIVFLAALIDYCSRGRSQWLSPLLTVLCAALMVTFGVFHFLPTMTPDRSNHAAIELARVLRANVAPDDVIIIAGLDWAATVPYYAQRRAVMLRREVEIDQIPTTLPTREQPRGARVGALLKCHDGYDFVFRLEDRLGPNPVRTTAGGCTVLMRR